MSENEDDSTGMDTRCIHLDTPKTKNNPRTSVAVPERGGFLQGKPSLRSACATAGAGLSMVRGVLILWDCRSTLVRLSLSEEHTIMQVDRVKLSTRILIATSLTSRVTRWRKGLEGAFAVQSTAEREALIKSLAGLRPCILLLDLNLPGLGGVEGISAVRRVSPGSKIVLLGGPLREEVLVDALKAGIRGYCPLDIEPRLLKKAVVSVHKGDIWIERKIVARLLKELADSTTGRANGKPLAACKRSKVAAHTCMK